MCIRDSGQQVDDVEVVQEAVDQGHDRVQNACLAGGFGHFTLHPEVRASVCLERDLAVEDVAGHVGGASTRRIGVGA